MKSKISKLLIGLVIIFILTSLLITVKKNNKTTFQNNPIMTQVDFSSSISEDSKLIAYGHIKPNERDFLLSIINLKENRQINQINLGDIFARKIFLNSNTSQVWIPAEYDKNLQNVSNKLKVFNIRSKKVSELEVGLSPVDVRFNNKMALVTCLERGIRDVSVYLINTESLVIIDKILIGGDTFTFSEIDEINKKAYFITQDVDNKVSKLSILDINTFSLLEQFEYPGIPLSGLKLIGNKLWLAGNNQIQIINPETNETLKQVQTDLIPYELHYDGKEVFLTHYDPSTQQQKGISIINPRTLKIKKIPLPERLPSSIMVKNNYLYIVDEMAGVLEVIDIKTMKTINTRNLGKFPTNLISIKSVR
jgi:DNA-binding beta-propeller fold protein YncE